MDDNRSCLSNFRRLNVDNTNTAFLVEETRICIADWCVIEIARRVRAEKFQMLIASKHINRVIYVYSILEEDSGESAVVGTALTSEAVTG